MNNSTKLNNKGISLVEVMVYMVVSLLLLTYAFDLMKSVTRNLHHERRRASLQLSGEDGIAMMMRDISQMGFKHYIKRESDGSFTTMIASMTRAKDTWSGDVSESSFKLEITEDNPIDTLLHFLFAPVNLGANNQQTVDSTRWITYSMSSDGELIRGEQIYNGVSWDDEGKQTLLENVAALHFEFSTDFVDWVSNPEAPDDIRDKVQYVRIHLVLRSDREGDLLRDKIEFKDSNDEIIYENTDTRYLYRHYMRTVEVPSNGK